MERKVGIRLTHEHTLFKYHLIKVHPEDWDERVEILKGIIEDSVRYGGVYFSDFIPFVICLNCENRLNNKEVDSVVTGKKEDCPKCGKRLLEWEKSTDVGLEWMTEPDAINNRILFQAMKRVRVTSQIPRRTTDWWSISATNCANDNDWSWW